MSANTNEEVLQSLLAIHSEIGNLSTLCRSLSCHTELEPQYNDENDFASLQSGQVYSEQIGSLAKLELEPLEHLRT